MFDNINLTQEDQARLDELYTLIGKATNEINRQNKLIDEFLNEIEDIHYRGEA